MANTFTTDYTGRSVDLLVFQDAQYRVGQDATVTMGFGDRSKLCTGVQKASQRWVNLFLSRRGTFAGYPTLGTNFMTLLLQGSLQNAVAVSQAFAVAVRDVQDYLLGNRTGTEPDDEVVSAANLVSFSFESGKLILRIQLTTLAGDARDVVVPISTVIR